MEGRKKALEKVEEATKKFIETLEGLERSREFTEKHLTEAVKGLSGLRDAVEATSSSNWERIAELLTTSIRRLEDLIIEEKKSQQSIHLVEQAVKGLEPLLLKVKKEKSEVQKVVVQKEIEKLLKDLRGKLEEIEKVSAKDILSKYTSPNNYLSVRLTDGNQFYKAISEIVQTIADISKAISFRDSTASPTRALVDEDGHVQVDVLSGGGGGTLRKDGETIGSGDTGSLFVGRDPTGKARFLAVGSDGRLDTTTTVSVDEPLNVDGMVSLSGMLEGKNIPVSGILVISDLEGTRTVGVTPDGKLETSASVSIIEPLTVDGQISTSGIVTVSGTYDTRKVVQSDATQLRATVDVNGQVDVSDRATRNLGKVDISGFDVSLPQGSNVIGNVGITESSTRQLGVVSYSGVAYTPIDAQAAITPDVVNQNVLSPTVSGNQIFITDILVSVSGIYSIVEFSSAGKMWRRYHLRDGGGVVENLRTPLKLEKNWGMDATVKGGEEVFISFGGYEK